MPPPRLIVVLAQLAAVLVSLGVKEAAGGMITYRIASNGSVLQTSSIRYFQGRNDGQMWAVDDVNNRIAFASLSGGSFSFGLGSSITTSLFSAADIVHLVGNPVANDGTAWVTTADGNSYRVASNGSVLQTSSIRYFQGRNDEQMWAVDDVNNRIAFASLSGGSFNFGPGSLITTALFSAADIVHLVGNPFANDGTAWVTISTAEVSSVPEPSSLALLTVGVTALGGRHWRRRKRNRAA